MRRFTRRGQALTEFALILPILLLIVFGVFDFGRAIFAYNNVANAAREAGRTAIINQVPAVIRARAVREATGLGLPTAIPAGCPAAGGPPSAPAAAGVCVAFRTADLSGDCSSSIQIGCNAVVAVQWPYHAITPLIGDLIGTIPLSATTTQTIENVCPRNGVANCQIR